MGHLETYLELQSTHDLLATIQRDLSSYPPDMSKLDADLKTLAKRRADLDKLLGEARTALAAHIKELAQAQKGEESARAAIKAATQKVQYAAAIRELDERERQRTAIQKPLKALEARLLDLENELAEGIERASTMQTQFDELKTIFLSEHENQVEAQTRLMARKTELEVSLPPTDLTRFHRILQQRSGRAVVPFENGLCSGCRTRIRLPMVTEIRVKGAILCESCQRILYDPVKR